MNNYTIYCTEEQAKKALELGAPIHKNVITCCYTEPWGYEEEFEKETDELILPTAEQMVNWLEEQNVNVTISNVGSYICSVWRNASNGIKYFNFTNNSFSTRAEATLAAIDAALDYLIKNKNGL